MNLFGYTVQGKTRVERIKSWQRCNEHNKVLSHSNAKKFDISITALYACIR